MTDEEYADLLERLKSAEREARNAAGGWKKIKEQKAIALWCELRRELKIRNAVARAP